MKKYTLTELPAAILLIVASAISVLKTRTGLVEKLNSISGGFAELIMDTITDMALGSHEGFSATEVAVYQGMGNSVATAILKGITADNDLSKESVKAAVEALDFQSIMGPLMEGLTDDEVKKIGGVMMKLKGFIEDSPKNGIEIISREVQAADVPVDIIHSTGHHVPVRDLQFNYIEQYLSHHGTAH